MENHTPEDKKWQALLARTAPTFAGETTLPFGFLTSTLARIKAEKKESEILERIGIRALFAASAVMVAVVGVSIGMQIQSRLDFNPDVKSFAQSDVLEIS